jgi:hypothetical protein
MKFKTTTERLFNKENVFKWIETLQEWDFVIDNLTNICNETPECHECPFQTKKDCPIAEPYKTHFNQWVLQMLYETVRKQEWEDEDDL